MYKKGYWSTRSYPSKLNCTLRKTKNRSSGKHEKALCFVEVIEFLAFKYDDTGTSRYWYKCKNEISYYLCLTKWCENVDALPTEIIQLSA